jgi:ABC-type multidrug transport system ATPase subunit
MGSIILEARGIRYRYPHGIEAISGISFHIRKKEKLTFVGPNGAGKSTLLMMFNGIIRPDSGVLLFDLLDPAPDNIQTDPAIQLVDLFPARLVHLPDFSQEIVDIGLQSCSAFLDFLLDLVPQHLELPPRRSVSR